MDQNAWNLKTVTQNDGVYFIIYFVKGIALDFSSLRKNSIFFGLCKKRIFTDSEYWESAGAVERI